MIVFDLSCSEGHRFEGWFGSSDDFASQCERGLVACPKCGSAAISKAPMAPAVGVKGNRTSTQSEPVEPKSEGSSAPVATAPIPPELEKAVKKLAEVQTKALKHSTWVGKDFAEKSRAMHYGETDTASIHGQATLDEAKDLADEGIAVSPLPFPVAPPEDLN